MTRRALDDVRQSRVWKQATLADLDDDRSARFIASSNRVDRYGDIVEQNWELADFWRNPVFLWGHQSWQTPIGWVREFSPDPSGGVSTARVEFLPAGADDFVDKLHRLVQLGAVRAVSVGFIPTEVEDRFGDDKEWLGYRFMKSSLIELSLCSVPANSDAVALAKSLDPHPAFLRRVFSDIVRTPSRTPIAPAHELVGFTRRNAALSELRRFKGDASP